MTPEENLQLKEDILTVILANFGDSTEKLYRKLYGTEEMGTVLNSVKETLIEMVGKEKAMEQLEPIYSKYNIKGAY